MNLLFIYFPLFDRPEFLKDIVGNAEAVSKLSAIAQAGNLPNIILSGPPGSYALVYV